MADNSLPKVAERSLPDAAMANVTHVRVVSTDNSEKLPIENLTLAGTKVTVAVDGLPGTVDGAFADVLTKIAGKADTAQVQALDVEKLDIANVYNALDKTVDGFALDARQGKALDGAKVDKVSMVNAEHALADIVAHLEGRIKALEELFVASAYSTIQVKELSVVENVKLKGADLFLFGTAAPTVPPDFIGQFFINTAAGVTYQAKGITNAADWKATSNA
jgi:hypothetical protein